MNRFFLISVCLCFWFSCAQQEIKKELKDDLTEKISSILDNRQLRKQITWLDQYNNSHYCAFKKTKKADSKIEIDEVIEGVYRMSWPTVSNLLKLKGKGKCEVLINLTEDCLNGTAAINQIDYCKYVSKLQASEYINIPIAGIPNETDVRYKYFKAMEAVIEARKNGKTVCCHCSRGVHRTGLLSMLLEKLNGKAGKDILEKYYKFSNMNGCYHSSLYPMLYSVLIESEDFNKLKK